MRQRAVDFQTIDLLPQELVVHRELTHLRQEIMALFRLDLLDTGHNLNLRPLLPNKLTG